MVTVKFYFSSYPHKHYGSCGPFLAVKIHDLNHQNSVIIGTVEQEFDSFNKICKFKSYFEQH